MALSRRFLNLIVDNGEPGVRSLRFMDLKRLQLFYPTTPPSRTTDGCRLESAVYVADAGNQTNKQAPRAPVLEMQSIRLPRRSFTFQACRSHCVGNRWNACCFPLAERMVLCTDQCGRSFLYDGDKHEVVIMPNLHKPNKPTPISLFVPSEDSSGGGSLFLMESIPEPVNKSKIGQPSEDFEVLVYHKDRMGWHSHCQLFPPPPYVHEPSYNYDKSSEISSYSVVSGGSLVCISVKDRGTYVLNTARHLWDKVGDWVLPFLGKVEYVPELKLWFGLSADSQHLVAADLSTMDSQPQLVGHWKKELCPPEEWIELRDAQVVNLGSGRFCIARFFITSVRDDFGFRLYGQKFVVLTGVEVVPRVLDGNGKVKLEMILHKSRLHTPVNDTSIEEVS